MRELGIQGAVRGKRVITTVPGDQVERAPDLVDRDFVAAAPNRCWAADFTHVKTWSTTVYVAFVVDTFSRRIVGWSAATAKETVFVLDALEMAIWQRDRDQQSVRRRNPPRSCGRGRRRTRSRPHRAGSDHRIKPAQPSTTAGYACLCRAREHLHPGRTGSRASLLPPRQPRQSDRRSSASHQPRAREGFFRRAPFGGRFADARGLPNGSGAYPWCARRRPSRPSPNRLCCSGA
ncbi:DDE-type integrase/transposase/recombinase [Streptomyces sp. CB01580]|uniref:DDE-type integrase/transposase/recombinase n=1 Tax=Streptomyces sp. CB01580 TaxID=1703933 RepID=UPI003FD65D31